MRTQGRVDRRLPAGPPAVTRAPIPELAPGERTLEGAVAHYLARVLRLRAGDALRRVRPGHRARGGRRRPCGPTQDTITVRFGPLREGARARGALAHVDPGPRQGRQVRRRRARRDRARGDARRRGHHAAERREARRRRARAERQARWARIAQRGGAAVRAQRRAARRRAGAVDGGAGRRGGPRRRRGSCLWEQADRAARAGPLRRRSRRRVPLAFACGPEGGLEAREVDEARARGWIVVSLGPLALRTETVAAAVLGAVRVWEGLG